MTTFSKLITSTNAGATSDTFTDLGDIELNDKAAKVVGVWMIAENVTTTTAEGNLGQYVFDFTSMSGPRMLLNGPPNTGAAIGTQSTTGITNPVLLPVDDIEVTPGGKINCQFSQHTPDPTAGCSVVMGVMYTDGNVHSNFGRFFPGISPFYDADTEGLADAKAASETASTALDVPQTAKTIVGFGHSLVPDAVQANGEEMVGFVRYKSTLSTWTPQEYPLPAFAAPLAGTTVGQGCYINSQQDLYYPASIPCGTASFTVTPYSYMNVALSAAVAMPTTVFWV
jgi:hypothetical protein